MISRFLEIETSGELIWDRQTFIIVVFELWEANKLTKNLRICGMHVQKSEQKTDTDKQKVQASLPGNFNVRLPSK